MYLLFPLAFVSGIYGFFFFAPYLVTVVAIGHFIRVRRHGASQAKLVVVPARIEDSFPMARMAGSV